VSALGWPFKPLNRARTPHWEFHFDIIQEAALAIARMIGRGRTAIPRVIEEEKDCS
jgi:hypothetical protein